MEGNKGEKKANLFREKSLETIESPESLNDYLRVTSPGVWIILAAVIALLVGGIFLIRGQLTLGEYMAFSGLTWGIANPMRFT